MSQLKLKIKKGKQQESCNSLGEPSRPFEK